MKKTPLHVKIRRSSRELLNLALSKLFKKAASNETLDIHSVKTIAIIRPNYRIGNLIFLTPLINEMHAQNPGIKIDLFVGMGKAPELFDPVQNINKTVVIPRKLLAHPLQMYRFIKNARKTRYDVAFNLVSGSVSSQIVTTLINARYKVAFKDKKSWSSLTHEVEPNTSLIHAGLIPLALLGVFGIKEYKSPQILDLKLTDEELSHAKEQLQQLTDKKAIALFRDARYEKKIADEWWSEFVEELYKLDENIAVIDILSPDVPTKLNEKVLSYSNKNLRELCAFFGICDIYISADTGPLHLAASSKTSCRGLFNKTSPEAFGLLGKNNKNIDINGLSPQEVAKLCLEKK